MSERPPGPRRKGLGCLSVLVLYLLIGGFALMAIDLAFNPWIYFVGGAARFWPVWEGTGVVRTPSGPYRVYVWFSPTPSGSRVLPSASVRGWAYVCTPKGQRYSLRLRGGASGQIWKDMDGHTFALSLHERRAWWTGTDGNPRLSFSGRWVGPNLVMSDDASIAHAFLPDGSLSSDTGSWHPTTGALPITLTETRWWPGGADCD